MKPPIPDIEREIVEEFALFDDWEGKYQQLIYYGETLAPDETIEDEYKTPESKVQGCVSDVWVRAYEEDSRIYFKADSNSALTKGLIALLVKVLSGQPAAAIAGADMAFIERIGLEEFLTPQRSNGLHSMIRRLQTTAREHAPA